MRFAGRRLILNVKNLATVLLGNLQPKAISETARISCPKSLLHAQRHLCLKRVPLEPDTAETCPQSLHVFGIIEIQRTAAKMSQEKLKIKKA